MKSNGTKIEKWYQVKLSLFKHFYRTIEFYILFVLTMILEDAMIKSKHDEMLKMI